MKKLTRNDKRTKLEKEIEEVLEIMALYQPDSIEYTAMMDNLEKLYKAKANERERRVSADTVALIAANLLGLVLIMTYEKTDIITTKALGFIVKGRV